MNKSIIIFNKLNSLIFHSGTSIEQKKVTTSRPVINHTNSRFSKDEFIRELRKTLSVLALR